MTSAERPTLAVIGGSGFYEFLDDVETVEVETPYGAPSAPVTIGEVGGRRVAFLPRHGKGHTQPPHDRSRDPYSGLCPYHGDCLEGLASGPAIAARWGNPLSEVGDPAAIDLIASR